MKELITVVNDVPMLDDEVACNIVKFERQMKELNERRDNLKRLIKEEMERKNIISIKDEFNGLTVTYVPQQSELEKFNKDKFKKEHRAIYDEYVTLDGKREAYIVVKTK